ncbi:hypothetical protein HKCCE2091_15445 [Rhodobacterales bacterium HKCCE2091]|nr:hypothetical protein [Rhodobacterales bacterium HKCCE2091]
MDNARFREALYGGAEPEVETSVPGRLAGIAIAVLSYAVCSVLLGAWLALGINVVFADGPAAGGMAEAVATAPLFMLISAVCAFPAFLLVRGGMALARRFWLFGFVVLWAIGGFMSMVFASGNLPQTPGNWGTFGAVAAGPGAVIGVLGYGLERVLRRG